MQKFPSILVGLNTLNTNLLNFPFLIHLISFLQGSQLTFLLNDPGSERGIEENPVVGNRKSTVPGEEPPQEVSDMIKNQLPESLKNSFTIIYTEGNFSSTLLSHALHQPVDLVILSRSIIGDLQDEALKIAKNAVCSTVIIPESLKAEKLNKVIIPVDFSGNSKKAFDLAIDSFSRMKISVLLNHVYFVPIGYHATGKSYEESAALEKQNAKKLCKYFLKDYDVNMIDIQTTFVLDDDKDPTDKILKEAIDSEVDLIIMSAKGKTNSPTVITGSITNNLLLYNAQLPLMILKNRKDSFDLAEKYLNDLNRDLASR